MLQNLPFAQQTEKIGWVGISIKSLIEGVAKSEDSEAKNLLKSLLENTTVGSLIGAGASALIGLLSR